MPGRPHPNADEGKRRAAQLRLALDSQAQLSLELQRLLEEQQGLLKELSRLLAHTPHGPRHQ
jgi:hypothetical protein